jgi:acetaldehyde dehydrogenase/alcohol dehydrogenase
MAHKLGAEFGLAHGLANALLISNVIRYNAADIPTKQTAFSQYDRPKSVARYAEIARHLGLEGERDHERVEKLVQWVDELKQMLNIPMSIQAAGWKRRTFWPGSTSWPKRPSTTSAPGPIRAIRLISELKQLLLDSYYGRAWCEAHLREAASDVAVVRKSKGKLKTGVTAGKQTCQHRPGACSGLFPASCMPGVLG